jgi:hypothetical protein
MLWSLIRTNHKILLNEAGYGFEVHVGSRISSGAKIVVKTFICAFYELPFHIKFNILWRPRMDQPQWKITSS